MSLQLGDTAPDAHGKLPKGWRALKPYLCPTAQPR
jgi:hypothetical protein